MSWTEVFRAKASVYALHEQTKQWTDRGTSGVIVMYWNTVQHTDVRIKWEKSGRELWWCLIGSKLKPKGERAVVLKAWASSLNQQEILAIRFADRKSAIYFSQKYHNIYPPASLSMNSNSNSANNLHLPSFSSHNYHQNEQISLFSQSLPTVAAKNDCLFPNLQLEYASPMIDKSMEYNNQSSFQENVNRRSSKAKWRCAVCTYLNDLSKHRCVMCGLPKQLESEAHGHIEEPVNQWNCRKCTFSNPLTTERCCVCGAVKYINNGQLLDNSWECMNCTLLNNNENERCRACQSLRSASPAKYSYSASRMSAVNGKMGGMAGLGKMMNSFEVQAEMQRMRFHHGFKRAHISSEGDFRRAASDITCYNDNPSSIFSTLRSVAKKLLKSDIRYRTLDTTNPKVMERLIGFEGVLDFLILLGFESDAMGMKLIAEVQPSPQVVRNAINVLSQYQSRFRVRNKGNSDSPELQIANKANDDGNELLLDENISHTQGFGDGYGNNDSNDNNNNNNDDEDALTLEQIILWATHESQNNDLMDTLLLTHKTFTDSLNLLKQLRRRFFVPIPEVMKNSAAVKTFQISIQKSIQLKVIKALRTWLKQYWNTDFYNDTHMLNELREWMKDLKQYSISSEAYCTWILPWYEAVMKEFLRFQQKGNQQFIGHLLKVKNFDEVTIPKKFNIQQVTAEMLADQLTLMAFRVFQRITPRELLEQKWKNQKIMKKEISNVNAPNVIGMIKLFNSLTVFVQIQILTEKNLMKRSKAIKRVIRMGQRFRELRNYNSLCAVFGALNSAPIHRLKIAWKRVPEKSMQQFQEWAMVFCSARNHRNLRQLIRKFPGRPCIPHLGVLLQDLIYIDEGNDSYMESNIFSITDKVNKKMINFSKCVRIADRIKNISMYQMQTYQLKDNDIVQKVLIDEFSKVIEVTEDEIWDMSTEVKRSDLREAKGGIFRLQHQA